MKGIGFDWALGEDEGGWEEGDYCEFLGGDFEGGWEDV